MSPYLNALFNAILCESTHPDLGPQAIFDCCHAGTLLDLPHYHCNAVYVPWISKGERRTKTLMNRNSASLYLYFKILIAEQVSNVAGGGCSETNGHPRRDS